MLLAAVVTITASVALAQQTPTKLTLYKTASSAACSGGQTVWVDPDTKTYYPKGDKLYGKTKHGGYNCRKQADAAGYRAPESR
jgi:hypothetical protein